MHLGKREILQDHAAGNLEVSQINKEHLLPLNFFMLLSYRADWGYTSIAVKPLLFQFPYSLTLIHCPWATKYAESTD